jgi:hypothetical protein
MADWTKITKEEFDAAYNKHLPSGWIKFAYKYFSKETEMKDMAVKKTVVTVLLSLFGLGFLATVLNLPNKVVGMFVIPYSILLAVLVLYLFSAVFLNNFRIGKIRRILGVTKWEYNSLVSKFYS